MSEIDFWGDDLTLIRLAREIAMDHHEFEKILERYGIDVFSGSASARTIFRLHAAGGDC